MRPVFADPKTDVVFKRLFGTEPHKPLLIALLNALLELDEAHRIVDVRFLSLEQRLPLAEMKLSIVDVRCIDATGTHYVVEMQVFNVEGFESRVFYNVAKAFVSQLRVGEDYPKLNDVVGVTICDFILFPNERDRPSVPMLSRFRMQEQHVGTLALSQVQFVFLELPKYVGGENPSATVDRWALFFREAENLQVVPAALSEGPFAEAMQAARVSGFTEAEWEAYERAKVAEQDARGVVSFAEHEGHRRGREEGLRDGRKDGLREGLRKAIDDLCEVLDVPLDDARRRSLEALQLEELELLRDRLKRERHW